MSEIKAIETRWNGFRFRSRLEARWAIFLTKVGLKWEYEPHGFDLDGDRYLPDFWLPEVKMYAEVKPIKFSPREESLAKRLPYPCLMLIGAPDYIAYWAWDRGNLTDFIIDTSCLKESRLFGCTGDTEGETQPQLERDPVYRDAIEASRAARFEFGDSGTNQEQIP